MVHTFPLAFLSPPPVAERRVSLPLLTAEAPALCAGRTLISLYLSVMESPGRLRHQNLVV